MILQSFCPSGKRVLKVTVYPSDFGKERMAHEAKFGPQGIWKENEENHNDDEEDEEDEDDDGEENDDLYENIEDLGEDEGEEGEEWEDVVEDESEEEEDIKGKAKGKGKGEKEEFKRKQGAVGIVLHDDLVRRRNKHNKTEESEDDEDEEMDMEDEENDEDDGSEDGSESGSENAFQKPMTGEKNGKKSGKKTKDSGFNVQKLREYELSKLRYYFAIAECDHPDTAGILAEQLDDIELQDTAMALEIRFVPDELDLSDREVRDTCTHVPLSYKPPSDFIINALQHTNVKCTWDEGEREREKKLTNINAWRSLRDSDFMQYIASSDSDDEEEEVENEEEEGSEFDDDEDVGGSEEEEEEEGGVVRNSKGRKSGSGGSVSGSVMSVSRKKSRAKSLRKLLLGAHADDSDDDEEDGEDGGKDDFFLEDGEDNENDDDMNDDSSVDTIDSDYPFDLPATTIKKGTKKGDTKKGSKGGVTGNNNMTIEQDGDEMVLTYIPEAGKELLDKKKNKEEESKMTPYELSVKRATERKKEKKAKREQIIEERKQLQKMEKETVLGKMKGKVKETEEEKKQREKEIEKLKNLIGNDRINVNDDMKLGDTSLKKAKKNRKRGKQSKEEDVTTAEGLDALQHKADKIGQNFKVDVTDERFKKVFEGDAAFGIERTAHEFKETSGMKTILETQRKHRVKKNKQQLRDNTTANSVNSNNSVEDKTQMNNLVNRLKRKFQE